MSVRADSRSCFRRWIAFNIVGGAGVAVQLGALVLLRSGGLHYMAATALAVEAAVLHNFVWHERWTWSDRACCSGSAVLNRLFRFNLTVGVISITENLIIMKILVERFAFHYLAANVVTIAICSFVNFLFSDRFVFSKRTGPGGNSLPAAERLGHWRRAL